jgi:hypothetical protein
MKRFHGVVAGNVHECSLKLSIGIVSHFMWLENPAKFNQIVRAFMG